MKKNTWIILLAAVLFMLGSPVAVKTESVGAEPVLGGDPVLGGWENVPCEAGTLPEDAQAAFAKATEGLEGAVYTPAALLSTQLVAGRNYCILCQITSESTPPAWALVYIYADLQGNAEIMNVYELYIGRHAQPAE